MDIRIKLFATLRHGRGKELSISLEQGATPKDAIGMLEIAEKDIAILLINGRDGTLDQPLADGDIVAIFPPVGGG
ncbi:MoaD/ThiS family protein [Thermotalea metallivorans]|uniref:Molybdopterin synthase sulfur carrier subunit n=1 Tax=Thermotalea metallivorans TaxID=520762 RepID=A0A140L3Y0_9FIRM|nr:MoaD/ThiS family protein [Thermotalea metallivorans]KXG75255.1 hypothetical protein AN619_18200 [Thermotalea metallivorans]